MQNKIVGFGEILLRLSADGPTRLGQAHQLEVYYGGAEANVVGSLANFGLDTLFVTAVPENALGAAALAELRGMGVQLEAREIANKRMGIYFVEHGISERPSKVLYDRSDSAFSNLRRGMIHWKEIFKDAKWFHWSGISPALNENVADVCLEALEVASGLGITISADLNYRATLWQYGKKPSAVMPALIQHCDVLLGGSGESEIMLGIKCGEKSNNQQLGSSWMQAFPKIKMVAMTMRKEANASSNTWSAQLFNGSTLYQAKEYKITHIADRIGIGDAFMAGFIYGLITKAEDHQYTVDFATAAALLKHTILGDCNRVTVKEVEQVMQGSGGGRMLR